MGEIIFIALAVVLLVFFAGYRKVALALAVVVLAVGGAVYYAEHRQDMEVTSRMVPSDVVLQNVTFNQTFRSSYDLRGKMTNKSDTYAIDRVSFAVTLKDCPGTDKAACVELGRTSAAASVRVPPQETRDFAASMYFGSQDFKPKGNLVWEYEIESIVAKRP